MQVQRGNMLLSAPLHRSSGVVIEWTGLLEIHKCFVFIQIKTRKCMKPNIMSLTTEYNCKEVDT
jgi:hypothetical protein